MINLLKADTYLLRYISSSFAVHGVIGAKFKSEMTRILNFHGTTFFSTVENNHVTLMNATEPHLGDIR